MNIENSSTLNWFKNLLEMLATLALSDQKKLTRSPFLSIEVN